MCSLNRFQLIKYHIFEHFSLIYKWNKLDFFSLLNINLCVSFFIHFHLQIIKIYTNWHVLEIYSFLFFKFDSKPELRLFIYCSNWCEHQMKFISGRFGNVYWLLEYHSFGADDDAVRASNVELCWTNCDSVITWAGWRVRGWNVV